MTYIENVPNASQSPGNLPAQATENFTRLKAIINAEHVFNDTAGVTDGVHRFMTLINRSNPVSVPAGTNSMVYSKLASDSVSELWFYDAVTPRQVNWRELSGTVVVSTTGVLPAVPANSYGQLFLFLDKGGTQAVMQAGAYYANALAANAYAYAEKYNSSDAGQILNFSNFGVDAQGGLIIQIRNVSGATYNGTYNYRILYRLV